MGQGEAGKTKRAGDVLAAIFDERLVKKAQNYSSFFAFWEEAVKKNGIAAAADHSRIREFDRGILLVEADHPGWKQILQTKQGKILNDFRRRFPKQNVSGISLVLSQREEKNEDAPAAAPAAAPAPPESPAQKETAGKNQDFPREKGYGGIKNDDFKKSLKSLEKSIAEKERDLGGSPKD